MAGRFSRLGNKAARPHRPDDRRIAQARHMQRGEWQFRAGQRVEEGRIAAGGIPSQQAFWGQPQQTECGLPLSEMYRIRRCLKQGNAKKYRVRLRQVDLRRTAIGAKADHMGACFARYGTEISLHITAKAGKTGRGKICRHAVQATADLSAAFPPLGLARGAPSLLASIKLNTSGRMLSRQDRPANMP